uniref:uncharacterized protein LOC113474195 n=1 Tax=Ciona intestinalis TaxID=7719 RepID=UPI000EF523C7|nr:uncharacterized protein LOC113474195 [Ciona intestinalis]|eukprot:XP_026690107.1 uncharacterized protein LOC113474195 [Ciona intestinalis]
MGNINCISSTNLWKKQPLQDQQLKSLASNLQHSAMFLGVVPLEIEINKIDEIITTLKPGFQQPVTNTKSICCEVAIKHELLREWQRTCKRPTAGHLYKLLTNAGYSVTSYGSILNSNEASDNTEVVKYDDCSNCLPRQNEYVKYKPWESPLLNLASNRVQRYKSSIKKKENPSEASKKREKPCFATKTVTFSLESNENEFINVADGCSQT